ncbi:MAG: hypothetical protein KDB54_05370 [Solirubrobacterales bacterium]|nr:hypothetical protein [Solirubrobacterales bacterium]MCB0860069.1 hypothetical protein [Solirubrobacterales bacterium]HRV61145.1 hypothetical protein [Solirubrobacterales bacterium]
MNKVRTVVAAIAIVAVGAAVVVPSVSAAVDPNRPLKVRVFTPDGKQRLKVKRKIAVVVGCTKNCAVVVDMKLVMPGEVLKARVKGGIKAFSAKSPAMILNTPAIRYLRFSYPRSRFSVKVTATDISNGKRVVKRKVFRFRR